MSTLSSWSMNGGEVVAQTLANSRAKGCLGCKSHRPEKAWEKIAKSPVAQAIKMALTWRNRRSLSTPHDKELGVCQVCGCCCEVKIWTPLEDIEDDVTKFPDNCWFVKECGD